MSCCLIPASAAPAGKRGQARVEALFALAGRIEARLATARCRVERLPPATLSKAFRSDLVPQDPNDEPASQLLERLGQSSASSIKKARKDLKAR